ncbi:MAG: hypothetical protein ABFS45_26435, partial [Pseudomonadota bacterium]
RSGGLSPGSRCVYRWSCNGEPAGSIGLRAENGRIVLDYSYQLNGGEREHVECPVQLSDTSCNYGGSRSWFLCPIRGCGRRVAILYQLGKYFGCRHCGDLAYSSQQEREYDRMMRKSRKSIKRLGGNLHDDVYPNKPKHMHWKTYDRLISEAEYYEDLSWKLAGLFIGCRR